MFDLFQNVLEFGILFLVPAVDRGHRWSRFFTFRGGFFASFFKIALFLGVGQQRPRRAGGFAFGRQPLTSDRSLFLFLGQKKNSDRGRIRQVPPSWPANQTRQNAHHCPPFLGPILFFFGGGGSYKYLFLSSHPGSKPSGGILRDRNHSTSVD